MKANRGDILGKITKKSSSLPAPWQYDQSLNWINGYKPKIPFEKVKRNVQKMNFKWKGVAKEN